MRESGNSFRLSKTHLKKTKSKTILKEHPRPRLSSAFRGSWFLSTKYSKRGYLRRNVLLEGFPSTKFLAGFLENRAWHTTRIRAYASSIESWCLRRRILVKID